MFLQQGTGRYNLYQFKKIRGLEQRLLVTSEGLLDLYTTVCDVQSKRRAVMGH
jgi:hypothetical protein